jgi:hypothetical protein
MADATSKSIQTEKPELKQHAWRRQLRRHSHHSHHKYCEGMVWQQQQALERKMDFSVLRL